MEMSDKDALIKLSHSVQKEENKLKRFFIISWKEKSVFSWI